MIENLPIHIEESEIKLLREKIKLTRWPDEVNDKKWSHGTSLKFMKSVADYWVNNFDWRHHEDLLNKIGSYKFQTSLGLKIHFLQMGFFLENYLSVLLMNPYHKCLLYRCG